MSHVAVLDGDTLLATTGSKAIALPEGVGRVVRFSIAKDQVVRRHASGLSNLGAMAVSPRGDWAAVIGREGGAEKIDLTGDGRRWVLSRKALGRDGQPEPPFCCGLAVSGDGQVLACGMSDGSLHLFRTDTWAPLHEFPRPANGSRGSLYALTFWAGDGKLVATTGVDPQTGDSLMRVWDVRRMERLSSERIGGRCTHGQALSPDGQTLATTDQSGKVRFWELETRQVRAEFPEPVEVVPWSLAFSPDGRTLAVSRNDGAVKLYHGE